MTGSQSRTPPRFVPTLTTVLEMTPEPAAGMAAEQEPIVAPPGKLASAPVAPVATGAVALDPRTRLSEADAFRLEEQLLHRVLQRVDLSLEMQLSDAVSAAVQHQLDMMIPRLRAEIETVLRALVVEAMAQELSDPKGSAPALGPQGLG